MSAKIFLSVLFLMLSSSFAIFHRKSHDTHNYYVLHHDSTYASLVDVAGLLGVEIVEPVGELHDFWLARAEVPYKRAEGEDDPILESFHKIRNRTLLSRRGEDFSPALKHVSRQLTQQLSRRSPAPVKRAGDSDPSAIKARLKIEDPLFTDQWSLINKDHPASSLNVVPVWEKLGYTGKGVITSVVDDGVFYEHEDLKDNFVEEHSYDFVDNQKLPKPVVKDDVHGTACAGIIASAKNTVCGVGIAYNSKIAGIRLLGEKITPDDIAKAINLGYQDVSIYSCSFGPADDGKTIGGPAYVTSKALLNGVNKGRKGKGNIYVFAAGNGGGKVYDNCNYDGYVNSIYTIAIGSLDHTGQHAPYSESCSALMAMTYASSKEKSIVTLDIQDKESCRTDFGTTSSSAPAAAAIFALALEARPELTWRDIQYLCVTTARVPKEAAVEWDTLASGRKYSYELGFGALDAYEFVKAAKTWALVPPQAWIHTPIVQYEEGALSAKGIFTGGTALTKEYATRKFEITQKMVDDADFDVIEHVQVRIWVKHDKRGDIEVVLGSPKTIMSEIGVRRLRDNSKLGLRGWAFSTLKHWGEHPVGSWTLSIKDQGSGLNKGKIIGFSASFWGRSKQRSVTSKLYELPADDGNVFPPPKVA